uniref:Uncharacterized protein n=1 Tax=Apteryx owenii TaxID=8824 RepID=A0A8B9PWU3_APTOW
MGTVAFQMKRDNPQHRSLAAGSASGASPAAVTPGHPEKQVLPSPVILFLLMGLVFSQKSLSPQNCKDCHVLRAGLEPMDRALLQHGFTPPSA